MPDFIPALNIRHLYDGFDLPVASLDCGSKCAPHNPRGLPFCCDICQAVPAAFLQEWAYLQKNTNLWSEWRGDECSQALNDDPQALREATPEHMVLLACQGPDHCQREFRALSCRQFPFFPYVTADYRFLGLAYDWEFEQTCWVISNLSAVEEAYWHSFITLYDHLFALWDEEFESYAIRSEEMRQHYAAKRRRIPILHRNGGYYLLSPGSERVRRIDPQKLPRFGPYKSKDINQ
jgi:hypothetical protein